METDFTKVQQAAIGAEGSAAVIAGAGSGKTLVLIEHFRHLIEKGVPLHRILAFTFTEKAAGEIRQRLLQEKVIRDEEIVSTTIGTLHSFLTRLLRRHGPLLNLDPDFTILGEAGQALALETRLKTFLLAKIRENNPVILKYAAHFGFARLYALIKSLLAEPRLIHSRFHSPGSNADLAKEMAGFFDQWLDEKIQAAALHYDDLEYLSLKILKSFPEVREGFMRRFSHILVDEFQDTNIFQGSILNRLFDPALNHLFIVGDPKQSIYRFRRADVSIFRETVKKIEQVGGARVSLNETFRLPPALTAAVNKVFTPLFGENGDNFFAPMESLNRTNPGKLEIVIGRDEGERDISLLRKKEAQWIAQKIASLNLAPEEREECALLFRTSRPMAIYRDELIRAQIPCRVTRSESLFENQEILDFLKMISYLAGDRGILNQAGIMRSSFFDFSENFIDHFINANCPHFLAPYTAGLFESDDDKQKWENLMEAVKRWSELKEVLPARQLSALMVRDLAVSYESIPHFEELLNLMGELEETHPLTLEELDKKLLALADSKKQTEAPGNKEGAGSVLLMTIHAAKGLEFKRVFLPQLHAGERGDSIDAFYDRQAGLLLKEEEPGAGGIKIQLKEGEAFAAAKEKEEAEKREESKRLLYVAMTRAKEELTLFLKETKKKPDIAKSKNWNEWLTALLPEERETAIVLDKQANNPALVDEQANNPALPVVSAPKGPLRGGVRKAKPSYSVSQIETFLRCGKEYELKYQFGIVPILAHSAAIKPAGTGEIPAQKWGVLIHEIFQFLDFSSLSNLKTVVSQALANLELVDHEGATLSRVQSLVLKILEKDSIRDLLISPEKVYKELPFFLDCGDFFLKGTFDRLVFSNGKWMIVDYKTDRIKGEEELKAKQESYRGQMTAYAVALNRILGVADFPTALLFTDQALLVREEWDSAKLTQAITHLNKAHQEMEERSRLKEFHFAADRAICQTCPYFALNYCGVKN